jgi:hypothetical protein
MHPLFISAHDDLLDTAISKWRNQLQVLPQHYLMRYNVPLNNVGLKTRRIDLVHWTNGVDLVRVIKDLEHPMYKDDTLKNFVPEELVVKAGEQLALRGSRQLAPSFFQMLLDVLTSPGDNVLDLTAEIGMRSTP